MSPISLGRKLARARLLIAYLVLAVGLVLAFAHQYRITERVELEGMVRAHENCRTGNETRAVIAAILDRLAEEREDDAPGEHEDRMRLRAELDSFLQPNECPPLPRAQLLSPE